MSVIRGLSGYVFSSDYDLLYRFSRIQSVVCEVDFRFNDNDPSEARCRDICATRYVPHADTHSVGCRGRSYIEAESLDSFVSQCQRSNLRWIVPDAVVPWLVKTKIPFDDGGKALVVKDHECDDDPLSTYKGLHGELLTAWEAGLALLRKDAENQP